MQVLTELRAVRAQILARAREEGDLTKSRLSGETIEEWGLCAVKRQALIRGLETAAEIVEWQIERLKKGEGLDDDE